jgi:hypothetical protein
MKMFELRPCPEVVFARSLSVQRWASPFRLLATDEFKVFHDEFRS